MKSLLLSTVLLVAIFPTLAQAQLWPQSQADRQAQAGQGHAQVPNYWANADAHEWSEAQVQALTWPYFKPTTSKPVFSLYDALGRPENLKIGGMFRSRIEGISNQFRPAPVTSDDVLAAFRTNIFAEYDTGHKVKIGAELLDSRGYLEKPNSSASTTEVNALELGQAYLNFDLSDATGDGSKSSLTAGRFIRDIGSRRLVARNDYRNTINAFTGAAFDWQGANKDQMTLLWTMPHTRLPSDMAGILDNAIVIDRENLDLQLPAAVGQRLVNAPDAPDRRRAVSAKSGRLAAVASCMLPGTSIALLCCWNTLRVDIRVWRFSADPAGLSARRFPGARRGLS